MMMLELASVLLVAAGPDWAAPLDDADRDQAAAWIEAMKSDPRGPYRGVLWFCKDGATLPPKPYACQEHGGGIQHGVPSRQSEKLGDLGLFVGTVLSAVAPAVFVEAHFYRARAYIVEAYLERALDGWVLAKARSYRGFRQVEDEQEAARGLAIELARRADLLQGRSLLARFLRALPYGEGGALAEEIRTLAGLLGDADMKDFGVLRFKLHAMPEPSDIEAVEAYAAPREGELATRARELAQKMRAWYDPAQRRKRLEDVRRWLHHQPTRAAIEAFLAVDTSDAPELVRAGARVIEAADKGLLPGSSPKQGERNLLLLHTMQIVEHLWIGVTADLSRRKLTRAEALDLVEALARSMRPLGWLSAREQQSTLAAVARMRTGDARAYASGHDQLGRVLEWARARVVADVGLALGRYRAVEPRAASVVDDQLRSSVVLPLAVLLDRLGADVERRRGGGHQLIGLGAAGSAGLRGENPGLATGPLRVLAAGESPASLKRSEVVLLHDLPPELPPVAGILTVGAPGSLSHVSLLARNLGIPHATVPGELASALDALAGQELLLGVSAGRRVALGPMTALTAELRPLVEQKTLSERPFLAIDARALDLTTTDILPLAEVSERDSGVRVGPKAAELGRLARLFPQRVSGAAVIPFGAFVQHVDRAGADGAPSPLARLKSAYAEAGALEPEAAEQRVLVELERFRAAISTLPFAGGFEAAVMAALARLGKRDSFGVFVRSDTNVEDLKEFTGAGLNLTVANRVRLGSILAAIRAVWASPFTERSYRWRQRILKSPEHVYPSVILHRTVPSDISGVMVTTDLETIDGGLTISASEGVAAVVDGGAPETLVVAEDGSVRLLASSRTATRKLIPPPPAEGVRLAAAKGRDPLLSEVHLDELVALAGEVQRQMPVPADGAPWDIEFGFVGTRAYLMQIRPLRLSRAAGTHPFLRTLDAAAGVCEAPLDLGVDVVPIR